MVQGYDRYDQEVLFKTSWYDEILQPLLVLHECLCPGGKRLLSGAGMCRQRQLATLTGYQLESQ